MRTICMVASDYLGLLPDDCDAPFDYYAECIYYTQKEDDPDHPTRRIRVCGNCLHWIVVDEKDLKDELLAEELREEARKERR